MQARQSKDSLLKFTSLTNPRYVIANHHRLIAERLEQLSRGDIDRLMIFMPPRHGKSELASVRFPAWHIGNNPQDQLITASYGHKLAAKFGRQARNLIASKEYAQIFPDVGLSADSEAKDLFHTTQDGAYMAVGVDGPVTGSGGDIVLIDDPIKSRKEAESEIVRDTAWDWYRADLYTRLMPGGRIGLIQTRWHEDDLAGRLLEQDGRVEEGGEWTVLDLPAINDAGEALWPEWYPIETLERIKATIGPRDFSALYQQQPQPDEGTFFQRGWFKYWDELPALRYYGTSDYAVTDDGGDYTVHSIWGIDSSGAIYRVDQWKGQTTADIWIEEKLNLIAKYKPLAWFGESGVIRKATEPMLQRRMRERKVFCRLEWIPSIHDKPTRARAFQSRLSMGKVFFEQDADISEFLVFPAGKHDDEVDTASLIGMAIDQAHPAIVQIREEEQPDNKWARAFGKVKEESWKTM